ncbi:glucokinase [Biformimicrobium ophioploci]|uniref:Glucokinase n=1 Tax=Biformimicrobium ophioploci TaxID=3036711 RepID=A0ABQ6M193_9GAMM|nr:glucokinase [Microbulbifer sp. NKW57]GMG88057.1 glucokinase [Microbulbifer sp. NKW57]
MTVIVADIGGTNARFALATQKTHGFELSHLSVKPTADFDSFGAALDNWLQEIDRVPNQACFAGAGPVMLDGEGENQGRSITMTNLGWCIDNRALQKQFGFERVEILNDFEALALSLPHLDKADTSQIKPGKALPHGNMAVVGPGTGLGVAGLVPNASGHIAVTGEGGHRSLAPASLRELELLKILMANLPGGRQGERGIDAEHLLCGSGLVNLYRAVAELEGVQPENLSPAVITERALDNSDPICRATVIDFLNLLGGLAGDLALTLLATGGVFIGGGIVPRIRQLLPESNFVSRFEHKGKMRELLADVPVQLLEAGQQALVGAAAKLSE